MVHVPLLSTGAARFNKMKGPGSCFNLRSIKANFDGLQCIKSWAWQKHPISIISSYLVSMNMNTCNLCQSRYITHDVLLSMSSSSVGCADIFFDNNKKMPSLHLSASLVPFSQARHVLINVAWLWLDKSCFGVGFCERSIPWEGLTKVSRKPLDEVRLRILQIIY